MEFLLSIWYSFDLVTSIKVNHKPVGCVRRHARSLGDTLIGRHVVEADPILLAKYKPLLRLYMHSNFIDTVLLYR